MRGVVGYGDVWTWVAIDAASKLVIGYMVGARDGGYATEFMQDVASRLTNRVQLTTDGHKAYLEAVEAAFGGAAGVDYAQLIKIYGEPCQTEARYSPAVCSGTKVQDACGMPDSRHVSTSYVERQNLIMLIAMWRFTRLTNAFSKKLENHVAAIALHYMHYNFCRIHQTLRVTPAMEAGIASRVWEIDDIVALLEAEELAVIGTDENNRGPYKKKA